MLGGDSEVTKSVDKHVNVLNAIDDLDRLKNRLDELFNKINGSPMEDCTVRENISDKPLSYLLDYGAGIITDEISSMDSLISSIEELLYK